MALLGSFLRYYISPQNLKDFEFDLSGSLKANSNDAIALPTMTSY